MFPCLWDQLHARRLCGRKMSRLAKHCGVYLERLQGPCRCDQGTPAGTRKLVGITLLDI